MVSRVINSFYEAQKHFNCCSKCGTYSSPCDAMEEFAVRIESQDRPHSPAFWIETFSFYHDRMLNSILRCYRKFSEDFVALEPLCDVIVGENIEVNESLNRLKIEVLARGDYENVRESRFYQEEEFARLFYCGLPAEYCLGVVI